MTEPRLTPGGLATQFSSVGHYDLGDDQAMIVTVPRWPDVAPYQGIQLGSMWYISLDYINHQTSLTADQARTDPDGMIRFVVSERDPASANWLECTGHRRGYLQFRWQRLSRELGPADGPQVEVVPFAELPHAAAVLRAGAGDAAGSTPSGSPPARPPSRDRMLGLMTLLDGQGGRGLRRRARAWDGRSRCRARGPGADVVLAARTESRLEEVATRSPRWGAAALAVPTDITDDASAARAGRGGAGRVRPGRRAGEQRVRDPAASTDLADVDLDQVRAGVRDQRVRRAAADPAVRPGARREPGLGRDDQLVGAAALPATLRCLQDDQGRLLALAQSLATELGPQGIRVNSVAPGLDLGRHR